MRSAFLIVLLLGACLSIGCSDDSTGPEQKTKPEAPVLASPSDGATDVAVPAALSWNASSGASSYRAQVSASATFASLFLDRSGVTATSTSVTGLAASTVYYWRVNAANSGGTSEWSAAWSFTTAAVVPPAGEHIWSKRAGADGQQYARAVAAGPLGDVVVAGYFTGTVDFGGGALTSAGELDIFVAKYSFDGTHLWSKRFGDGNNQYGTAVRVDASGSVILAGSFGGTVNFGGGALTSADDFDIFVAKYSFDGTHLWSKRFGDGNPQELYGVAVDASDNMIITGTFGGTIDFGGGALMAVGGSDIFVAKFGSDGAHLWSKRFGGAVYEKALAIAVDPLGTVAVAGEFWGSIDFGGGALTSAGANDVFVAKFGSGGAHLWSKRFGDADEQTARAITVDPSGTLAVAGEFGGSIDFGGGALTSAGYWDAFVAKLGPDGTHLWSKRFGGTGSTQPKAVAADASGNVFVTGHFDDTTDFGGGALATAGMDDIFIAKLGSDGAHVWSKRFGDVDPQNAWAAAVDASGNAIITGEIYGTVDFGGGPLTGMSGWDIFVAKFAP